MDSIKTISLLKLFLPTILPSCYVPKVRHCCSWECLGVLTGSAGQLELSDWCCWFGWAAARPSEPMQTGLDQRKGRI